MAQLQPTPNNGEHAGRIAAVEGCSTTAATGGTIIANASVATAAAAASAKANKNKATHWLHEDAVLDQEFRKGEIDAASPTMPIGTRQEKMAFT